MSDLRAFIALVPPREVQDFIAGWVAPLRALGGNVRWTKPENVHLTLRFLGNASSAQVDALRTLLRPICTRCGPIETDLAGAGAFPDLRRPRVLWLGLTEPTGRLDDLAKSIEHACGTLGFPAEQRRFTPHLTIGRVKDGLATSLVRALQENPFPSRPLVFRECTLMKSELRPGGSLYTPLEAFPFQP